MPISLKKGQKVSLTKSNPGLKNVLVGVGWDVNAFDTGGAFDLDGAAFLLTDSGKVSSSADFVFYGNLAFSQTAGRSAHPLISYSTAIWRMRAEQLFIRVTT